MRPGWVPVSRELQDHWMWDDKPFAHGQAWIDLIMLANYEDTKMPYKGEIITCERGTVNLSISYLANRWGWSRHKTRDFLNLLESDGMVTVCATTNRTTITLENYSFYNDVPTTKGQRGDSDKTSNSSKFVEFDDFGATTNLTTQTLEKYSVCDDSPTTKGQRKDSEGTAKGQRGDTTNNNNKNNKNNNIYSDEPKLDTAVKEFITFRKKIKKPMTDHAVKLMISKLNKLTSDIDEQVEILNQSILNGWQGIYPLKREENKRGQNGIAIDESKDDLDDLF